ncbi:MAG TPA: FAD-binding oxidoreductase [Candidatus Acidoferrales bacterium]|jgi:FAD/FMN-containing dehydrogenase|nr:FAD-binding oxidoreductase [Candidatus Acidoferrales bacterium]
MSKLSNDLQSRVIGKVTDTSDPFYEALRRAVIWNELIPARYPRLILQAKTEQDVVEAVRFARANRMKIAVRAGGHNWVGFSLVDDSLLIDLGSLREMSIDTGARTATVQPGVRGGELNDRLARHDLAFPVGHCPTVSLSGYLLNGGQGWNSGTWGVACFSVQAANVVTADSDLLVASEQPRPDLLWAIRGAGPGFFGVVTQYHLKIYPAPRAIAASGYYYPLQSMDAVGAWAASVARQLPEYVELTMFCESAPPALAEQCRSSNGYVAVLSATAFADSQAQGAAALALLDRRLSSHECLDKTVNQPRTLTGLLQSSGLSFPEKHRYLADTCWVNSPVADVLAALRDRFLRAPSPKSLAACVFGTGAANAGGKLSDGAYSMTAKTLLLCYAIWERPEDDASNAVWHRETIAELDRFAAGHYIGESDIIAHPNRAERSFTPASWERLKSLRQKYDPDGLFHSGFGAS